MDFTEFATLLMDICKHSTVLKRNFLLCTFIVNPAAGGFTQPARWETLQAQLKRAHEKAMKNPPRDCFYSATALNKGGEYGKLGLILVNSIKEAGEMAMEVTYDAYFVPSRFKDVSKKRPFYLIVTAGGDGTNNYVLAAMMSAPEEVRRNIVVLRLPFGTGNDGACAKELDTALDLLIEPSEVVLQRGITISTASGRGPFYAFNILSIGLDAFVTHMTNKMKGKLPRGSYKLWVTVAALFYDLLYRVGYMDIKAADKEGKELPPLREKLLLLAMGISGRRTYGSGQQILPDDRNICAIKQSSLLKKLKLKKLVAKGEHASSPQALLFNASRVEIHAKHPLLAQGDGETERLEKKDFPVVMELTVPAIQIFKKKPPR